MTVTLAFDVYGTLIDTNGVVSKLQDLVGDQARAFSQTWRDKQLEYSFRRGLMKQYENFAVCTKQALEYTCSYYQARLSSEQKLELLEFYRKLPAFREVKGCLARLEDGGCRLYAFSNGSAEAVETLLSAAGIRDYFLGVVSVDDLRTFKPDPAVYQNFLEVSGSAASDAWLISGNPFDVLGAHSVGMRTAWIRRNPNAVFDPWGIEPTVTAESLGDLDIELFT